MTADRATLIALAERVEQAQGPDRLLDAEIAVAVLGFIELPPDWEGGPVGYGYICEEGWMVSPGHGGDQLVPEFTKSLDQVVRRLVPEGWRWMVGHREFPLARAYVENGELAFTGKYLSPEPKRNAKRQWFEVTAATPALALTAAALRAHAAMGVE